MRPHCDDGGGPEGGAGRGMLPQTGLHLLSWELEVTRFAFSERNGALGAERESGALSTEPHGRGAPHLITNALSLSGIKH